MIILQMAGRAYRLTDGSLLRQTVGAAGYFRMPPDPDPSTAALRRRLTDLRNGLLQLHKVLLDSESASYDHDVARITTRGQLLELVLHDPWFAWLHELSELVVLIDEALDAEEPLTAADAERMVAKARELVSPADGGGAFRKHYL